MIPAKGNPPPAAALDLAGKDAGKTSIKFNDGLVYKALGRALRKSKSHVRINSADMRRLWRGLLQKSASASRTNPPVSNDLIGQPIPTTPSISESDWNILASAVMSETVQAHERHSTDEPKRLWDSLSEGEKAKLNARAEDYRDVSDYWEQANMSPGARIALRKYFPIGPFHRDNIDAELDALYRDETRMLSDSSHAKEQIKCALQRIKAQLYASFDLSVLASRPIDRETQDRHRHWSKLRYQGLSWNQIAAEERKRGAAGHDKKHIQVAVKRHRTPREPMQQIIRELILRS